MPEPIITRKCSKCKQIKPLSDFYKDHTRKYGYHYVCKICDYKCVRKYRQTEHGKSVTNRISSKYNKSEKGKINKKRCNKLYNIRYPQRRKANRMIKQAIINCRLPRPDSLQCSCGEQANEYHHHNGYEPEHWFDVIPICIKCHNKTRLVG